MAYTAEQVKEMAALWQGPSQQCADLRGMLTAYADRLEQDEQGQLTGTALLNALSEGRREVYRKITEIDPIADMGGSWYCVMCGVDHHTHDCLWLEAHAALRETTPTP